MLYKTLRNNVIDWWRKNISKPLIPLFHIFERIKLNPNHLTLIGLLLGLFGVYYFYIGNHLLFTIFILIHILFDVLDGNYARYLKNWKNRGEYLDFSVDSGLVVVLLIISYLMNIVNTKLILISIILFLIHHIWHLLSKLKSPWAPSRTWLFVFYVFSLFILGIWITLILSLFGIILQIIEIIKNK